MREKSDYDQNLSVNEKMFFPTSKGSIGILVSSEVKEEAKLTPHPDLAWCLGKLRGLGHPNEVMEKRWNINESPSKESDLPQQYLDPTQNESLKSAANQTNKETK